MVLGHFYCFGVLGSLVGRTRKGAYSPKRRPRHLLETPFSETPFSEKGSPFSETPFSEPLLRTLLRTLFYCKTHRRPPSQNPSENPFPRTLSRTFSEPFSERCVAVRPLRRAPYPSPLRGGNSGNGLQDPDSTPISLQKLGPVNKLKTTPTPNKNGSYGIKGGFVCHKSQSSYAIKVGSCTIFSVEVPLFRGIFTPYDPSFYGIFWGHIFC